MSNPMSFMRPSITHLIRIRALALLLGLGSPWLAMAMSCTTEVFAPVSSYFRELQVVFVGRVEAVESRVDESWDAAQIGRFRVERQFKGTVDGVQRVVIPMSLKVGDRVLVLASANGPEARLRQTRTRWVTRKFQEVKALQEFLGNRADNAVQQRIDALRVEMNNVNRLVVRPDTDIPWLSAAGACRERAYAFGPQDSVTQDVLRQVESLTLAR
jgi:hypothetical protein